MVKRPLILLVTALFLVSCSVALPGSGDSSDVPTLKPPTSVPSTAVAKAPTKTPTKVKAQPTSTINGATPTPKPPTRVPSTKTPTKTPTRAQPTSAVNCNRTMTGGDDPSIPTIDLATLIRCRPEVRDTLDEIQGDGPFKYDQDNVVFNNREGILPSASSGTYHEYTVETPGASTRGTRRIITSGKTNRKPSQFTQLYYTDDHYQTIWLVTGVQ